MTDATQRGEAEAVEAAERLLPKSFVRNYRGNIGAAIAAAYPVIAAAVREQVAREIEADAEGREQNGLYLIPWAMRDAAKIARGVR